MKTIIFEQDRIFVPYEHAEGGRWLTKVPDYTKQVFSFHRGATGRVYHFDIARLLQLIEEHEEPFDQLVIVEGSLEPEEVKFVIEHHGIEEAGIARLTPDRLAEPGILCELGDGRSCLVDGNHRYVARFRAGLKTMEFHMLTEKQWRLALLAVPHEAGKKIAMRGSPGDAS